MAIFSSKLSTAAFTEAAGKRSKKPNYYFNSYGQFAGTDNDSSNEIRVLNKGIQPVYIDSKNFIIDKALTYPDTVLMASIQFSSLASRLMLSKICTYAYKLLKYDYTMLYDKRIGVKEDPDAVFYVEPPSDPKRSINVCLAYYGHTDAVNPNLGTMFNLLNLLIHEQYHFAHKILDQDVLEEINAYKKQGEDRKTFQYVTDDLRKYLANSCATYLAAITDTYTRDFLKNKIETVYRLKYNRPLNTGWFSNPDITLYPNV